MTLGLTIKVFFLIFNFFILIISGSYLYSLHEGITDIKQEISFLKKKGIATDNQIDLIIKQVSEKDNFPDYFFRSLKYVTIIFSIIGISFSFYKLCAFLFGWDNIHFQYAENIKTMRDFCRAQASSYNGLIMYMKNTDVILGQHKAELETLINFKREIIKNLSTLEDCLNKQEVDFQRGMLGFSTSLVALMSQVVFLFNHFNLNPEVKQEEEDSTEESKSQSNIESVS